MRDTVLSGLAIPPRLLVGRMAGAFLDATPITATPAADGSGDKGWSAPPSHVRRHVQAYDDYLIVHGVLPPTIRDALLERYFEAGRAPCGGAVWWPREVGDV
jgi:hypothetical protein